jgi:hypothetical protein
MGNLADDLAYNAYDNLCDSLYKEKYKVARELVYK